MRRHLSIVTLNIGNPSVERAQCQLEWLAARPEDVFVLTETSGGKGSELIATRLANAGWDVRMSSPDARERGVMIASRVSLDPRRSDLVSCLPSRVEVATLAGGELDVVGVYAPSRDATRAKIARKRAFLQSLANALRGARACPTVLIGDFNILEPAHHPRRHEFLDWEYAFYEELGDRGWHDAYRLVRPKGMEYSWVGPAEDGYRFDHTFVTDDLASDVEACGYVHETRELGLTDHSAMAIQLCGIETKPLDTDSTPTREHRALF